MPEQSNFEFYEEKEILEWFFSSLFANYLFERLELNGQYQYCLNVIEPFYDTHNKGDIDLLLYNKSNPDKAIVAQCKTIHVMIKDSQKEKSDRIGRIEELVAQSNEMFKLGFHKTYLFIFIQADCRKRLANNVFFMTGITKRTKKKYAHKIDKNILNENIGIVYIIYSQFADKPIWQSGVIDIDYVKPAIAQIQKGEITNKIKILSSTKC